MKYVNKEWNEQFALSTSKYFVTATDRKIPFPPPHPGALRNPGRTPWMPMQRIDLCKGYIILQKLVYKQVISLSSTKDETENLF